MTELNDYCFCCKRKTLCTVRYGCFWKFWVCKDCSFIFDEKYAEDECDSAIEQQAELEEWGEL